MNSFTRLADALLDRAGRTGHARRLVRRRMVAAAREADRAFAHPGPNRDDAQRLFWQAMPATLDRHVSPACPRQTAIAMVTGLPVTPLWPDIARAPLAEPYLLHILGPMLREMEAGAGLQ